MVNRVSQSTRCRYLNSKSERTGSTKMKGESCRQSKYSFALFISVTWTSVKLIITSVLCFCIPWKKRLGIFLYKPLFSSFLSTWKVITSLCMQKWLFYGRGDRLNGNIYEDRGYTIGQSLQQNHFANGLIAHELAGARRRMEHLFKVVIFESTTRTIEICL
jgi:hypothetical protein